MSEAELQALVRSIEELRENQREMARETEQALRESARDRDLAIDRAIDKMSGVFTSQWGKLVESLVEPSCVEQFRQRGIAITRTLQRAEGIDSEGRQMEIDVLLIDGDEVVAVEVKTNLKVDEVKEHEDRLERFRDAYREYRDMTVLGAVAALRFDSASDKYAYRRGLYVLRPDQGIARIINAPNFKPRRF